MNFFFKFFLTVNCINVLILLTRNNLFNRCVYIVEAFIYFETLINHICKYFKLKFT